MSFVFTLKVPIVPGVVSTVIPGVRNIFGLLLLFTFCIGIVTMLQ